jgi:outer membrane protein OmpA-like peptidoglycan-associated protein
VNDKVMDTLNPGPAPIPSSPVKGAVNEAGDFVYETGEVTELDVKGMKMKVGATSAERRLSDFLSGNESVSDDKTKGWITMDRLYFESGKTTLKSGSDDQLKNIAGILKSYPSAHIKIGGYTDNSGDAAANRKLSQERAEAAKAALVKQGVDGRRIEAEGYGSEHPVCAANDSPECKAQNRRIDIRVTQK